MRREGREDGDGEAADGLADAGDVLSAGEGLVGIAFSDYSAIVQRSKTKLLLL